MADALASKWAAKHDLFFGGRAPDKAEAVARGHHARAGTLADAAAHGEVVVIATPASAALDAVAAAGGATAFNGKVVIDITNPVDTTTILTTVESGESLTRQIERAVPDAAVGKAFNMAHTSVWKAPALAIDGRALVTPFTAAPAAEDTIARLICDVGSEPELIGDNAHAYKLEAMAAVVIKLLFSGRDPNTVLNLIRPEDKPVR